MDSSDPSKTTHPGQQGHGAYLCKRCGWPFPKPLPSARHRRNHKRICGTVPGYTIVTHDSALQTQYSALSSFSDDEHENGSDGDSKAPCVKSVVSTGVNEGGSGRPLERMNMSADDVFTDAVSEFADASVSLGGDEGFSTDKEFVPNEGVGMPVEDVAIIDGGNVQASIDHEASRKSPQEGTTTSPSRENVMSFSETPDIFDDPMTDPCKENKRLNAVKGSNGMETGVTKIDDASACIAAPVTIPVSKDSSESSKQVTEEKTIKDHAVVESKISQNEEQYNVKSDSETFMDDKFQQGETDEISSAEDIPQTEFDKLLTDRADEGSASTTHMISDVIHMPSITESNKDALVSNQVAEESISVIEGGISTSLSVDGTRANPTPAELETVETSLPHTGSGNGSEDSNEKDLFSLTKAPANDDACPISTTDENGQVGSIVVNSNIVFPDDGYDKMGALAEDFPVKVEGNASENDTKSESDNPSLNIRTSEEPVTALPVVLVQSADVTSESQSLQAERSVQQPLDVNSSLSDEFTGTTTVISKEVKLDDENPASELKPASHDVLLQKLEEDLSDDEPVESFPATESSSQSIGNNQVDDASKGTGRSQDPEKTAASITDAPYEINSPNGSSLDGNWGSVSVVSTMSDAAAGDVKKMKDPQGQSSDKYEMFDPPSFQTLIEPQAQKAAVASSTSCEVQNPQLPDSTKAAWFPSITNIPNDSQGKKKNAEIIAKVTNWSTGKQPSPLKTLLGEAKTNSLNAEPPVKNDKPVSTVNSILGSEEPDHPKDLLNSSGKDWCPTEQYPDEIKREKRKVKGRPYWVPFMCCSSVK